MTTQLRKEIRFSSKPENIHQAEKFVEEICDYYNINNTYFGNITIAITEAVKNAIEHGNNKNPDKMVNLVFEKHPAGLLFQIADEGDGFNFENIPNPTDDAEVEAKGLFLIRSLSDDVEFKENGSVINLLFNTSSIHREIAIDRINKLKAYNQQNKIAAK